jgi:hypothetical protein
MDRALSGLMKQPNNSALSRLSIGHGICEKKVRSKLRNGLPDGLFSDQQSQFGYILDGLAMEDHGLFYGHLI